MINLTNNDSKFITEYRDKMYLERNRILNEYALQTLRFGQMYYVYSENSQLENYYNICICEENMSNTVIEKSINELPDGTQVGSVLREKNNNFILDKIATKNIEIKLEEMINDLLEKQNLYLSSKRIEGHIYEVAENEGDRILLFDITTNENEGIEEIDFPEELLQEAKEGDLFIYNNGYAFWDTPKKHVY